MLGALLRIIGGLLLAGFGFLFIWRTEKFLQNFGTITWAEIKFGPGGSRTFYKLLGVIIIAVGLMLATNLFGGLLMGTVGRLFTPPS